MHSGITNYINKNDWRVKENSNQGFSLQGLNNYISGKASAHYWLEKVYTNEIGDAHKSGKMHIHDLSSLSAYCMGWDLLDLLMTGFTGVPSKQVSKPAKHFGSALMQVVNFMFTAAGEIAGAVALSNFDTLLAPFIHYDNLTEKEVKQHIQEFIFNMNVSTRTGFQACFSNITIDLTVPNNMKNLPVIIGGKAQKETYGEMQPQLDMFNKCLAEVFIEGDGNGKPFSFPIPTYNITDDFDWDNEKLDPLWEMTAKYGIPTFANFIGSDLDPNDVTSLCCRLRLDRKELRKRGGGGLFGSAPLTGSSGICTINLPRIGYHANGDVAAFYDELDKVMMLAKQSLIIKRGFVEEMTELGMYPYTAFYLRSIKESSGKYWSNHFSTIGIIGMSDALLNMFGYGIGDEKGKAFAINVLNHMRDKLSEFQEETGDLFNLEATPAEGTAYRLARIDQEVTPDIRMHCKEDYGSETGYYTNSTNLPVGYTEDLYLAMSHQEDLLELYTGGSVMHGFVGEPIYDKEQAKNLVKAIATNFKIPYFTVTPTFSICDSHGYIAGEVPVCPDCGRKTDIYSRVVGYLRPTSTWNDGKLAEFEDRTEYKV